jgi:hypothetical protein
MSTGLNVDGFTLNVDGVVRPATGLELEASRIFFDGPLRYRKIEFDQVPRCDFEVELRFQFETGLFEGRVGAKRVGIDKTIFTETFPTCRSLEEAKRAFDSFYEKAVKELNSVHDRAKIFR